MTDIQTICNIIDPDIDWSTKDLSHIANLKITMSTRQRAPLLKAIKSTYWPEAVPPKMIVASPESRSRRARTIIKDFIRQPLKGQKFLDFGCGNGDCVNVAAEMEATAFGFDCKDHDEWNTHKGTFTTNIEEIVKNGPYDVVLFYDVFDHMYGSPTMEIMRKLKGALKPRTAIYARCHPYSSRHGSHVYETFNKAYAHLFLTEAEMVEVGGKNEKTHTIINPNLVYPAMFGEMGLTVINIQPVKIKPEPIIEAFLPFLYPLWFDKYKISSHDEIMSIISIQFIDYIMRLST